MKMLILFHYKIKIYICSSQVEVELTINIPKFR